MQNKILLALSITFKVHQVISEHN